MSERIQGLAQFWPYYMSQHQDVRTRFMHYVGTAFTFIFLVIAVVTGKWIYGLMIPLVGYGFAWAGHFFFEKNRPATFQYPVLSLICDYKMFFCMLLRRPFL